LSSSSALPTPKKEGTAGQNNEPRSLKFIPCSWRAHRWLLVMYEQFGPLGPRRDPRAGASCFNTAFNTVCILLTYICSHPLARSLCPHWDPVSRGRSGLRVFPALMPSLRQKCGSVHSSDGYSLLSANPRSLLVVWVTLILHPRSGA
jgi:hypothetical protein